MLAKRLRELREEKGYTQQEIANKLGLTKGAYGAYERGTNIPDAKTLLTLSEIFDVTADYLLGRVDNKIQLYGLSNEEEEIVEIIKTLTKEQTKSLTDTLNILIKKG